MSPLDNPESVEMQAALQGTPEAKLKSKLRLFLFGGAVVVLAVAVFWLGWRAVGSSDMSFNGVLLSIINVIFGVAACMAFIAVVVSGFLYATSTADVVRLLRSRRMLIYSTGALIGLLVVYIVLYLVLSGGQMGGGRVGGITTMPSPATGVAPFEVSFEAGRQAVQGVLYEWDFGDGSDKSVGQKTRHVYNQPGIFKVILTRTQPNGSKSTEEAHVSITNVRPATVIRASVTEGEAPLKVDFDGGESKVSYGRIVNYSWDFGDQASKENTVTGKSASHTFELPGEYAVILTTENESGDKDSVKILIKVLESAGRPRANIVTTPEEATGNVPLQIRFNGSGSSDDGGVIQAYLWDFGDGSVPVKTMRAEHTYQKPGEYDAVLRVTDNENNVGEAKVKVTVYGEKKPPVAKIQTEPAATSGPVPYQIVFSGSKSSDEDGQIVDFLWDFGDNTPKETTPVVTHNFARVGQYEVKLLVTDNDGLKATGAVSIKVTEKKKDAPVAVMTTDTNSGIAPLRVQFDAAQSSDSDGQVISYRWDFGDGILPIQGGAQASHVYETVGIFTAKVTVFDNDNLKGEATTAIAVNRQQPVARIKATPVAGKAPLTVLLEGQESLGNITQYQWDLGDGASKIGPTINHTYQQPGVYTIKLKILDPSNLTAEQSITVTVTGD